MVIMNFLEKKIALNKKTLERLRPTSSTLKNPFNLETMLYNEVGYFHRVNGRRYFEQMKKEWEELRYVPMEWIAKGKWPGIWMAMESPHNTYTLHHGDLCILRFYFRPLFYIFDPENGVHERTWQRWLNGGKESKDSWRNLRNSNGETLSSRARFKGWPYLSTFYEEYSIGVVIGYEDYISPVLVNPKAVESVKFLLNPPIR